MSDKDTHPWGEGCWGSSFEAVPEKRICVRTRRWPKHAFERLGKRIVFNVETLFFYEADPVTSDLVSSSSGGNLPDLDRLVARHGLRAARDALERLRSEGCIRAAARSAPGPPRPAVQRPRDLDEGLRPAATQRFHSRTVDRRPGCSSCWARYLCGGGCWKPPTTRMEAWIDPMRVAPAGFRNT